MNIINNVSFEFFIYLKKDLLRDSTTTKRNTTINDLNIDCKILIVERLSFTDLVAVADVSSTFSIAAANVFKRTFANFPIRFVTPERQIDADHRDKMIIISRLETIKSVLAHFGHLISHLELNKIYGKFEGHQTTLISQLINLHCSDTLKQLSLTIEVFGNEFFDSTTKPFEKVEQLTIRGDYITLGNGRLSLNELFPKMIKLKMYAKVRDSNCIDDTFANLKNLSIFNGKRRENGQGMPFYLEDEDVERFILKNKQIRNLNLECKSSEFLRFISQNLPDLEALTIKFYFEDTVDPREFAFENVRYLATQHLSGRLPRGFRNLEVYRHRYSKDWRKTWMDILRNNTNVKEFELYSCRILNEEDLIEASHLIPNVVKLTLGIDAEISDDRIIEFVVNNQILKTIRLNRVRPFHGLAERMEREIGDEWDIFVDDRYVLDLNRKENVE